MKILITGAHFTPAVAVIEQLKKNYQAEIVYVGRKTTLEGDNTPSQESQVLPKMGIKFITITTGRLQREFTIYTIPSLLKIPIGLIQSLFIILFEKPNVILSFGGYVALPTVFIGWLFSIPIIVHEQTLVSGLANQISALLADKIALSFDKGYQINNTKTVLTGNPIREEIKSPQKFSLGSDYRKIFDLAKKSNSPVILVIGGNQGSHTINLVIENSLSKLLKIGYVIHQTGDTKFSDFERLEEKQNEKYLVKKWIDKDIGIVLSGVDFVISRAGANTLVELAYLGKPVLTIPFEPLYNDEQNKNAKYFEDLGLARILPQVRLSSKSLLENIKIMLKDLDNLKEKARKIRETINTDAANRLALETTLLGKRN